MAKTKSSNKKYLIKLDCLIPAEMEFQITASSPEEALKMILTKQPNKLKMGKRKPLKAKVYNHGTISCVHTKTY